MDAMKDPKDVKALLDGDGSPGAGAAPGFLETRPGTCSEHGEFLDQQIQIRVPVGFKSVPIPYWLGCLECRQEAELANKQEQKRWERLQPGEPVWTAQAFRHR